jgi:hypothetical protein
MVCATAGVFFSMSLLSGACFSGCYSLIMNNVVTAADITTYCTGRDFSLAIKGAIALQGGPNNRQWQELEAAIIAARMSPYAGWQR